LIESSRHLYINQRNVHHIMQLLLSNLICKDLMLKVCLHFSSSLTLRSSVVSPVFQMTAQARVQKQFTFESIIDYSDFYS